jgi:DNA-binding NarL/FixJ family response regulator
MSLARIVLVEDDGEVRRRFADLLDNEPGFTVVGSFGLGAPARRFIEREEFEVLLIDLGLPDDDGRDLIRLCTRVRPSAEIVVVTVFADSDRVFSCLEAGATGYVLKDEMPAGIVGSVRMVLSGGSPVSPSIARRLLSRLGQARLPTVLSSALRSSSPSQSILTRDGEGARSVVPPAKQRTTQAGGAADEALSGREREILELVAKGLSSAEIGKVLSVSPHTVATHVKNIYRKLSVHSRTEAVYEARGLGLLRP